MARDIGGTGFVSLGDYLGANQGVLDAGYKKDEDAAHELGGKVPGEIAQVQQQAQDYSTKTGQVAAPTDVAGYATALDDSNKASEMGRTLGSEAGIAGRGANAVSPESGFNAALEWGAHGGDYKSLSGYLGGLGDPNAALAAGSTAGVAAYRPPPGPGNDGVKPFTGPLPTQPPQQPQGLPGPGAPHGGDDPNSPHAHNPGDIASLDDYLSQSAADAWAARGGGSGGTGTPATPAGPTDPPPAPGPPETKRKGRGGI